MKVKIFTSSIAPQLEKDISQWLLEKHHIKIKHITQSSFGDKE